MEARKPWSIVLFISCLATFVNCETIRVVSWNVGDNKGMGGGLNTTSLRQILGLEDCGTSVKAYFDIYAITFQESCFYCDIDDWKVIPDLVLKELNLEQMHNYEYVYGHMTRSHHNCVGWSCAIGQHGTTVIYVFAKRGLLNPLGQYKKNKCNGGFFKNAEKGIAGVKVELRSKGKTLCFAGLHLDSDSPGERRGCIKEFVDEHRQAWLSCDMTFYAGDFNTRTGDKGGPERSRTLTLTDVQRLRQDDEMRGAKPYGGKRLVDFISHIHNKQFGEGSFIDFYPTYSLKPEKECGYRSPCYRGNRPPSWTDRIICSPCNTFQYFSLPVQQSDHHPVFGIYTI